MRFDEISEAKNRAPRPVEWPTNLAWRIRFRRFNDLEHFTEQRRKSAFAMPFRNWETTYWKLTGKETMKIAFMPTEVIEVPPDAMVADMSHIDRALRFAIKNDPVGSMRRQADTHIRSYEDTMVPYSEFVHSPFMFEKPEILVDRASMRVLPYRVQPFWNAETKTIDLGLVDRQ